MVDDVKGTVTILAYSGIPICCEVNPPNEEFDLTDYFDRSDGSWKDVIELLKKDGYVIDTRGRTIPGIDSKDL